MSFSVKVKEELSRQFGNGRHCRLAEISAIINMCGKVKANHIGELTIKVQTENAAVARKYFTLIKKTFNINTEVSIKRNTYLKKNRVYVLIIDNSQIVMKILKATKLIEKSTDRHINYYGINSLLVKSVCCKRAYIRGAFLGSGSLSDPEKTYHLEFVDESEEHSLELQKIINGFEMDAKIVKRKKYYIVYLKEGSQIVDLLNIMGAHVALMNLENVRILKEMRNNVNRIVNCETANINKTVSAAVKQVEDIMYIDSIIGINKLPLPLQQVAQARLEYKSASLKEIGNFLDPPVGKSGVNHRLRKINSIAEKLREQREEVKNND